MMSQLVGVAEYHAVTAYHLMDPKPGDLFSEMCSAWVEILEVEGDRVQACRFGKVGWWDKRDLATSLCYSSRPGFFVRYHGNKP